MKKSDEDNGDPFGDIYMFYTVTHWFALLLCGALLTPLPTSLLLKTINMTPTSDNNIASPFSHTARAVITRLNLHYD